MCKLSGKGFISPNVILMYLPLGPIVSSERLGRPLRIYLHLWIPQVYTKDGGWVV